MEQQQIDELGFCPSFNCYSSDSVTSSAAIKISKQLQQEQQLDDFEFSLDEFASKNIDFEGHKVFPLFNRDLVDCTTTLGNLFVNERNGNESESSSSESEDEPVFCAWRPTGTSSPLTKCKKSSSTGSGSGSKRWRIRDLLRRSNSEGKERPMVMLSNNKKVENKNSKRSSGDVAVVSGKLKPSVHELFYVQQRAKREDGKRKSYLPYRQGLVGLFSNVNGKGNRFPF